MYRLRRSTWCKKAELSATLRVERAATSGGLIRVYLALGTLGRVSERVLVIRIYVYWSGVGFQDGSGLKRSIFMNSLRVADPKSFS